MLQSAKFRTCQIALLYVCCGIVSAGCLGWLNGSPQQVSPAATSAADGARRATLSEAGDTTQTADRLFVQAAQEAGWSDEQIRRGRQFAAQMRRHAAAEQTYHDENALDLVEWASFVAGYVAIAVGDRNQYGSINRQLFALSEVTDIADIWVTDSLGRVEYASTGNRLPAFAAQGSQLLPPFTDLLGAPRRLALLPGGEWGPGAGAAVRYAAVIGLDQPRAVIVSAPNPTAPDRRN